MKREDIYRMKLSAAKKELVIRQRILSAAQRGVDRVLKTINTLENKLK